MTEFTPGPWVVEPDMRDDHKGVEYLAGYNIMSARGEIVGCEGILGDGEANARLMAVAPDLYEELADMRKRFHAALISSGTDAEFADMACAKADAALAKAMGGSR